MNQLETKRLILRTWEEYDCKAVHAYASDIENTKYMVWGPNDTEEQSQNFITRQLSEYIKEPITNYTFAVVHKQSNSVIGGCNIHMVRDFDQAGIGWILNKNYWKQGLGTESAHELVRFGFEDLKLHRIYATCDSENYSSYRLMENCGMRKEGHTIQNRYARGEWRDEIHYAILSNEWKSRQKNSSNTD